MGQGRPTRRPGEARWFGCPAARWFWTAARWCKITAGTKTAAGIYADDESAPTTVILRGNAVIRGNSAPQDGGGLNVIFSQPQSSLQILDQAVIENNETAGNGGGLAYSGPPLTIGGDVKIINNSASGGGGINVIGDELHLTGNLQISENQGGGVSFSGARFQVDEGVTIQNNTCGDERGGGGINLSSVTEALIQGMILGNTAGFGGGIYVEASDRGTINLSGARFVSNRTTSASNGWGGGFYIYRRMPTSYVTALTLDNALFDGNDATLDGGGLCVHYPDQHGGPARFGLTATNCQFQNNTAGRNGGGAYLSGSANGSAAVFQNGRFLGNLAVTGAGLFVTFKDVSRGALTLKYLRIELNTAEEFGGGVALGSGNLDVNLQNVIIGGNKARIGGGLYSVDSPGRINVTDSSQFSRNTADSGGGIYHEGDRTLTLDGSEFVQNTAYNGWGVFNSGPLELSLQLKRLEGLFIQSEDDVPVLTSHLGAPIVWLEQSGYVLPNREGTPIVIARSDLELRQADAESFVKPEAIFTGWEPRLGEDLDQVVLAPVEYTLQYENTLGAQNPNPTSYTILTPAFALEPLASTPDFRFTGWFDALEGGSAVTEIPLGSTGDKTLYARWQAISHTLTYHGNDADGPPAGGIPRQQQVLQGETTELSSGVPTRTGFAFTGWNTDPAGGGTAYRPGQVTGPFYANLTLYAQWAALPPVEHTLAYNGNDAGGPPAQNVPGPVQVREGESVTLSDAAPTRVGFAFTGWNIDPGGLGTPYQPGETIPNVLADISLYAQWEALPPSIHTLTYYGNDAGGPPAQWIPYPVQVTDGQSVILSNAVPIREGFRFTGWNTNPFGSGTAYNPGDTIPIVQADTGLYAQWIPLPPPTCHMVTYCGNDAGGPPAHCIPCPHKVRTGEHTRITCCRPGRCCYCFAGWNTRPDGTGQFYWPGQAIGPVMENIFLFAQWKRLPTCLPTNPCHTRLT